MTDSRLSLTESLPANCLRPLLLSPPLPLCLFASSELSCSGETQHRRRGRVGVLGAHSHAHTLTHTLDLDGAKDDLRVNRWRHYQGDYATAQFATAALRTVSMAFLFCRPTPPSSLLSEDRLTRLWCRLATFFCFYARLPVNRLTFQAAFRSHCQCVTNLKCLVVFSFFSRTPHC